MLKGSNGSATDRGVRTRLLVGLTSLLVVFAVAPSVANATLRVQNHNDPAGDPTVMTYRITNGPNGTFPDNFTFQLRDGEDTSFGPGPSSYTIQAVPPAGWGVADIQCVGATPAVFAIDVPNGRVTVSHTQTAEDTCSFTNRRLGAGGGAAPGLAGGGPGAGSVVAPGTGVAPTPAADELSKVTLPKRAALLRVTSGRRFATARVRLTRASIVRAQLLWRKTKVAGSVRLVRAAGTYNVKVLITTKMRRQMQRAGLKRAPLTLKVVVAPRSGGAAQVFRFGVRVLL
jgi:hypothetical protein